MHGVIETARPAAKESNIDAELANPTDVAAAPALRRSTQRPAQLARAAAVACAHRGQREGATLQEYSPGVCPGSGSRAAARRASSCI